MPNKPNAALSIQKGARRRKLQKARKNIKRNRESRPPRRRDWMEHTYVDDDEWIETAAPERIMPRGERERRRAVEEMVVAGERDGAQREFEIAAGLQGQVVEVSSGLCRVTLHGRTLLCDLRGSLSAQETGYTNVVAVGDRVVISQNGAERGVVEGVLPRRNQITRPDPFYTHLQQTLVANVDQLLVVASWRDPHFWPELVDRYLIAAERNNVTSLLCVNKIDLAGSLEEVEKVLAPYRALNYRVILTSAQRGDGIASLRSSLENQVTVLVGLSGVGKSTLLSAVEPSFELRVGAVNEERHQGRHTTSQATMLPLGDKSYVIDTPGIREFGLVGLRRQDLIAYYPELAEVARGCRFSDCTHQHEPCCAVRGAAAAGAVGAMRLDSYKKIRVTLPQ